MAWKTNSFPTRIRAVGSIASQYGTPLTLHGYLAGDGSANVHREGDLLIRTTNGTLITGADNPNATLMGCLSSISARVGDSSQTPRQRTVTTATPDFTRAYDDIFSCVFYPWIHGNLFVGHVTDTNVADITADSNLRVYVDAGARLASNRWNFSAQGNVNGFTLGFVNPQPHSLTGVGGTTGTLTPGPVINVIGGATGTTNPLMLVSPKFGALMGTT